MNDSYILLFDSIPYIKFDYDVDDDDDDDDDYDIYKHTL